MPIPAAVAIGASVAPALAGLFGGSKNKGTIRSSGYYGPGPQIGALGKEYLEYLKEFLRTPIRETEQYREGAEGVREGVAASSAASRRRIADFLSQGGTLDSGGAVDIEAELARQEASSLAGGFREVFQYVDQRRTAEVLPFLQSADASYLGAAVPSANNRAQFGSNLMNAGFGMTNSLLFGTGDHFTGVLGT